MSNRQVDVNGFITIKKNPISKVGVFPYLGKNIDAALEPDKIYWVYRPAEELSKPETIESFRHMPIVDDHTMVGRNATPAENKGIHGVTGAAVVQEGDYLFADLHIYSDTLKRKIDTSGKKDLSMGYRVGRWEPANGTFNGQPYEFIQRDLLGNHLALVDEGRMGKEVSVLDGYTYDHMDIVVGDTASDSTASPTAEKEGDAEQPKEGATDMADKDEEMKKKEAADKATKDAAEKEAEEKKAADEEEKKKEAEDKAAKDKAAKDEEEKKDDKKAEDRAIAQDAAIAALTKQVEDLTKNGVKTLMGEISKRNEIAKQVEAIHGTFDHAEMTSAEVAAYGLKKAGLTAAAGAEVSVWEAFNAGRKAAGGSSHVATDSKDKQAPVGSLIEKTLAASK